MTLLKHLTILLTCSLTGIAHAGDNLLDIYLLAQKNDAELQVAEARYQATAQGDSIARSNWLPHVAFEYNLSETRQTLEGESFGTRDRRSRFTTRNDRLTLTQTLYHHDLYVELDRAGA
ncbi:MAG: TolC family protein, partial [Gammaproteobacteria bacterium]|nr:TolC family protein [Gammaproteobacteria bacterium]